MVNRIYLAGIVEREGRILLIRQTPRSQWELPGGLLLQRHTDADLALAEIMTTFGITFPDPEERFIDTIYLPDGASHLVYNIYASSEWQGEPEIPIGMGAGWYALDELASIDIREEVRRSILVTFGMIEEKDDTADILKAFASDPATPVQPPLAPLPEDVREFARPQATESASVVEESPATVEEAGASSDESEAVDPAVAEGLAAAEPETEGETADVVAEVTVETPAAEAQVDEPAAQAGAGREDESDMEESPIDTSNVISFPAPAMVEKEQDEEDEVDVEAPHVSAPGAAVEPEPVIESPPPTARGPEMVIDATRAPAAHAAPDRRAQGFDVLRTLGGNEPSVGYERMKAQYGELADDIVDFALGEVWYSEGLERKQRSLIIVAMIAALGGKDGPLFSHINGALNHGATPDEIVQVMRTVAVYAGFPAALEAWGVMEDVFRQRRVTPTGRTK